MLEAHHLSYSYHPPGQDPPHGQDHPSSQEHLLKGVSLALKPGEMVALVGGNGSGKSTLLRLLSGLLTPTSGHISLDGCSSADPDFLQQCRSHLGLVFQNPESQLVANTVDEEVAFGPGQQGLPHLELCQRVEWALTQVGLWDRRSWQSHALSAGQKQRLALASVLAARPRYLLLDEPTSMLDPSARKELMQLLVQLKGQVGILMITHRSDELQPFDRILQLADGAILRELPGAQLWGHPQAFADLGLAVPASLRLQTLLNHTQTPPHPPLNSTPTTPQPNNPHPTTTTNHTPQPNDPAPNSTHPTQPPDFARCEALSFTYSRKTPLSHQALTRVDCSFPLGSSTALIGQTGSGKSTLLQHLNLLLRPQQGRLQLFGHWVSPTTAARPLRQRVGMLFQQPEAQFFQETVLEEVAYGPSNYGLDAATLTTRALHQVDLPPDSFGQRNPFELSGGEQRRLALASVLAYQPEVLVLDEPTAGLDHQHRQMVWQLLRDLRQQGMTLVLISHDLEEVGELAEHVVWLDQGKVAAQGAPELLFPHLAQAGWEVPAWSQWAAQQFPGSPVPVRESQLQLWLTP